MAFEVRCPNCNKLYAAEWRLVGKRIRCRGCQHVFQIGAPADAPVHAAAEAGAAGDAGDVGGSPLSPEASHVGSSDLQKTREGVVVPPSKDGTAYEETGTTLSAMLRPSVPQQFPGSAIVEAWLPLGLGLISAVWVISQTFGSNQTGRAWVALVRIAIVAAFYLGLIVPITNLVIKSNFRKIRRVLPPSPFQRTAFTFALPLTLGYVFWLVSSGGTSSLITGLLLGIVLMAAVYWLLFRLDPQEAAQSYLAAASAFLACVAVSALILVGAGMWLNKAMVATDAARDFTENPIASPLAWNVPPAVVQKPKLVPAPDHNEPAVATPDTGHSSSTQKPPAAHDSVAMTPPGAHNPSDNSGSEKPSAINAPTIHTPDSPSPDATPPASTTTENANNHPGSKLFDVGPNSEGDSFLQKLRALAWVKDASCPTEQGDYDAAIRPLTPSRYIAFLKATSGQLEICQLSPTFAKVQQPIRTPVAGADLSKVVHNLALAPDASAVLRLWPTNGTSATVSIQAVNPVGSHVPSSMTISPVLKARNGVLPEADAMLQPELLGALPDDRFLVRWTSPGRTIIQVYSYVKRVPLQVQFELNSIASDVFAVDPTGSWYASVHDGGRSRQIRLSNLRNVNITSHQCNLPAEAMSMGRADCTGLAFNLNATSKMVAALFEAGGKGLIQSWSIEGAPGKSATLSLPAGDPSADHPQPSQPQPLAWIGNGWLVHGATLVSNFTTKVVGSAPDATVDGVQILNTDGDSAYLSYTAADGKPKTASVLLDPAALRPAASDGSGAIKVGE